MPFESLKWLVKKPPASLISSCFAFFFSFPPSFLHWAKDWSVNYWAASFFHREINYSIRQLGNSCICMEEPSLGTRQSSLSLSRRLFTIEFQGLTWMPSHLQQQIEKSSAFRMFPAVVWLETTNGIFITLSLWRTPVTFWPKNTPPMKNSTGNVVSYGEASLPSAGSPLSLENLSIFTTPLQVLPFSASQRASHLSGMPRLSGLIGEALHMIGLSWGVTGTPYLASLVRKMRGRVTDRRHWRC